jgi:DNA-binding SARP family transcriptional activator
MDFRILGPLEAADHGRPLALGGSSLRALLALLLLHANEVVSSDRLLDELWPEKPPASGATALQVRVSQLRKELGPAAGRLETKSPGYVLRVERGELDLERFSQLVEEADGAEEAVAAERLREALALWRGPPLADLAYQSFAQAAIARIEELRLVALERRIEADLALGRHAAVVPELEALVAAEPLRERLRGQLMLALYRSGRQAPTGSMPTRPRGARSSRHSGSSRARRCRSSSGRSCSRIQRSSSVGSSARSSSRSGARSCSTRCSRWPRRSRSGPPRS